jgi:RNA polymerase sigma-70 factor, ECF subfamily
VKRRQDLFGLEGGKERLVELFRRCSPDLHRYVRRRLRSSPDTADLIQEIFERFIRGQSRVRTVQPASYLFGIASNVVADATMAMHREVLVYDSGMVEKVGETLASEDLERKEWIDLETRLTNALEQLPEAHRAAILLTKRDGLSCKEAASKMGTTEGSVRVYVCEARARLKTLLKRG